jgi:GTPase SAR1 family protein
MNKKKAKILVIGRLFHYLGDAASGKSTLVQSYARKNYQFTSDYNMVLPNISQTQGGEIYSKIIPFTEKNLSVELFLFDLSGH